MGVVSSRLADRLSNRHHRRRRWSRNSTAGTCTCACTCSANNTTTTTATTSTSPTRQPPKPAHATTSQSTFAASLAAPVHTTTKDHNENNSTCDDSLTLTTTNYSTSSTSSSSSSSASPDTAMSKLSEGLKALINASHARPGYTKASPAVQPALARFARDAATNKVGLPAWVTVSTAVSATLNCPEAMTSILHLADDASSSSSSSSSPSRTSVQNAELIREVGLKCISFNGIPRTINTLGAFHSSLPEAVTAHLNTTPKRTYTQENLARRQEDGLALWDSVYKGFERKLIAKLAASHPDLPVHILASHYSNLLSDPSAASPAVLATEQDRRAAGVVDGAVVGRVLTSLVAIACLRAQTGVGPQVVSHVFGLRKAYDERWVGGVGGARGPGEVDIEGGEWLASEEGNVWLLESVDRLVEAIAGGGGGRGTTFAPGMGSKL